VAGHRFPAAPILRAGLRSLPALLLILALLLASAFPARGDTTPNLHNLYLIGPGGDGGTTTWGINSNGSLIIGTASTYNWYQYQCFTPIIGTITQFTLRFISNGGSPTGTVTWEIRNDSNGLPTGSVLATSTFTPIANTVNTITVTSGPFLLDERYWLKLYSTIAQSEGNFWQLDIDSGDSYPACYEMYSIAANLYAIYSIGDAIGSLTTTAGTAPANLIYDYISQSFTVSSPTILSGVQLDLRKYGAPSGTLTLTLESDFGNQRSGTLIDSHATATKAEADLSTSFAAVDFAFAETVTLQPGKYWIVLTTDRTDPANYIAWQTADFCSGQNESLKVHVQGVWAPIEESAIYQPDLVSISPVATAAPDTSSYVTLPTGQLGRVDFSMTGGEVFTSSLLIVVLILLLFLIFIVMVRRRG
jgi:hypothetical protein